MQKSYWSDTWTLSSLRVRIGDLSHGPSLPKTKMFKLDDWVMLFRIEGWKVSSRYWTLISWKFLESEFESPSPARILFSVWIDNLFLADTRSSLDCIPVWGSHRREGRFAFLSKFFWLVTGNELDIELPSLAEEEGILYGWTYSLSFADTLSPPDCGLTRGFERLEVKLGIFAELVTGDWFDLELIPLFGEVGLYKRVQ